MDNFESRSVSEKKAVSKAMSLLLSKMRTEKELGDKLLSLGFSEEDTAYALTYVKSFGYLNDEAYAEQYISSRMNQKGRSLLARELREKGISDEIIENTFEEIPQDNSEIILNLILKKAGPSHKLDEKENRRLFSFLARRGFASSDIFRNIKEYEKMEDQDSFF